MEEDRAANQRSAFSVSFTLALYTSNGFGLSSKIFFYHGIETNKWVSSWRFKPSHYRKGTYSIYRIWDFRPQICPRYVLAAQNSIKRLITDSGYFFRSPKIKHFLELSLKFTLAYSCVICMYICKWASTVIYCSRYSRDPIRIETLDFRIYTTKQF